MVTHRWQQQLPGDSTLSDCVSTRPGAQSSLSLSAVGCFQLIKYKVGARGSKLCRAERATTDKSIQMYFFVC